MSHRGAHFSHRATLPLILAAAAVFAATSGEARALIVTSAEGATAENCRHSGYELGRLHGRREAWTLGIDSSPALASQTLEDIIDLNAARIATMQLLEMECRLSVHADWFARGFDEGRRQGWVELLGYGPDGRYPGESHAPAPIAELDSVPGSRFPSIGESPRVPAGVSATPTF